ncbi:MAG: hypothetical protein ABI720_12775, partial [Actinomycetes bacterium]
PEKGLPETYYWAAIGLHVCATVGFGALVVRDVLWPVNDPVRSSLGADDPGGGVLDGRGDRLALRPASERESARSRTSTSRTPAVSGRMR